MKTLFAAMLLCCSSRAYALKQDISADLDPATGSISASAEITFARAGAEFVFRLHKGLSPKLENGTLTLLSSEAAAGFGINSAPEEGQLETYLAVLARPAKTLKLSYGGVIAHALEGQVQEYSRSFSETPGIISEKGCYLSGASGWYPLFDGELVAYRLRASLPAPYSSVSGGARIKNETAAGRNIAVWEENLPQDEINLTCGKYAEYARPGKPALYAFLQQKDDELAASYLDAAEKYAAYYSALLGPYPYAKFALVENFWDTGYGMPSFTLLGPKVLRLPFIINSSYPHEVLHNWWGNGVFVDYPSGNWCEGLTAYLADYLIAEACGKDRDYRASTLKKYAAYVRDGKDFPLTEFRSRHSSASEAVGYGKALMFYHMLRAAVGDAAFTAALRDFYAANRGRAASFGDLRAAFERQTGKGRLEGFFAQWVERAGAPELVLKDVRFSGGPEEYAAGFTLEQAQAGPLYSLKVPVVARLEGIPEPRRQVVSFSKQSERFTYTAPARILSVAVDPDYDLFRRLSPLETPPALATLLGAKSPALLLPGGPQRQAWAGLAAAWDKDPENRPVIGEASAVPAGSYWLLGDSALSGHFEERLEAYGAVFTTSAVILDGREFPRAGHTFVFADYHEADAAQAGGLIESDNTEKLGLLANKLPHYGKYSWLVFDEAMNSAATGTWPARRSPLAAELPGVNAGPAPYPARKPLAPLPSDFSAARISADAKALASLPGGRGPGSPGHKAAADYVLKVFEQAGLKPFQPGPPPGRPVRGWKQGPGAVTPPGLANITGIVEGAGKPGEYVVLAAHYDHLPSGGGKVYPGADDNASGVALLLELARYYAAHPRERGLIFAAFDGEERGRLGSQAFAGAFPEIPASVNAALNFDTVGRLGSGKILVLGSSSSDKWVHILRGAGFVTGSDYSAVKEDLDSSDQASFIAKGVPALQFFSGPNADYHKPTDTFDKLDISGIVKQAEFAKEMIDFLAGPAPFITRPAGTPGAAAAAAAGQRKVSTGLVPDFTYQGEGEAAGVRAQDITPGSPLAKAGIKAGVVVLKINGVRVTGLREYSVELKRLGPGAKAALTLLDQGAVRTVELELDGAK